MSSSSDYVSVALRQRIAAQARFRCGYCLRTAELLGMPLTIEHIIPHALGGETLEENLWLACHRCNGFKGIQIEAFDPMTNERFPLFNPR